MKRMLFIGLGVMLILTSCVKKKVTPTGDAHVRFVNAVNGSVPQDIYIDNAKTSDASLAYPAATGYFVYAGGLNLITFTNKASTDANLSYTYGSNIGDYATVYLFRDIAGTLSSGGIVDDMTAPPAGKARVRFVNLQNYLSNPLKVSITGGADLFTSINFAAGSAYYNVDPGTTFTPSSAGVTTAPVIDAGLQAGKIYTIWLGGNSATEINGYVLQ